MATIIPQSVSVYEGSGASFMARVLGNAGTNITQASISSITCNVYNAITLASVATPSVVVASSVFDTLQTDSRWDTDTTGYNFRHDLPPTAFPDGDIPLVIEYLFTPASGDAFRFVQPVYVKPLVST